MPKNVLLHFRYFLALCGLLLLPALMMLFVQEDSLDYGLLLFLTILLGVTGIACDVWATRQSKKDKMWIWEFSSKTLTGSKLLGHPLEEYFFFIVATPYVIFFWELLNSIVRDRNAVQVAAGLIVLIWVHAGALLLYRIHTRRIRNRAND